MEHDSSNKKNKESRKLCCNCVQPLLYYSYSHLVVDETVTEHRSQRMGEKLIIKQTPWWFL